LIFAAFGGLNETIESISKAFQTIFQAFIGLDQALDVPSLTRPYKIS
jgi:hypothetical protein